jgi:Concanavalin A-like lectin/glucanases superfamily/FecR protein
MNLTDKEILELNALCNALVDESINETQKARLSHWLASSADARKFYIRAMGLSASLFSYAGEMQSQEFGRPAPEKIIRLDWVWRLGLVAAAACLLIAVSWYEQRSVETIQTSQKNAPASAPVAEYIAQLTGSKECQWVNNSLAVQPGGRLYKGQKLELAKGFAEITFDSGAQVVLQGPASLSVDSAWAATLNRGTLKASIPPEAMGFSISNPIVEVVDLGTEFTMFADATGPATEVLVLKGEVEAQPELPTDQQQPIVLRETEARCFTTSGVSVAHDTPQKIAQLTESVPLDHFIPLTDYMHWSFNELDGDVLAADDSGTPFSAADFHLKDAASGVIVESHGPGHWQHALQFDGHMYAKAALPDISENTPHTVVFWVKVPRDANLSNAYAMVAWGVNSKNFGSHPVHIGWNRNPNQGPVGVLRTDFGGGFALGSTPLRDGHWHHIAVVLIPGEDANTSMQVKQYVDGRLEGEGKPSPPGSEIFTKLSSATSGAVWLGCRLGIDGVRQERFRGELDELFISDRALEPVEIVGLMENNRLPQLEIAATKK